jgi:hypothetical protein
MKKYIVIVFSLFLGTSVKAQGTLDLGLQFAVPTDDFKEATDGIGAGFNIGFRVPIVKNSPVLAGFDFGYLLYGSQSQNQTLEAQITSNGQVIDVIQMPLRIETNNNIYHTHLSIRAMAPLKFVRPYVEAMAGFRYYNTRTVIHDESPDFRWSSEEDHIITRKEHLGDIAGSYGFGLGTQIQVGKLTYLDLRFDYLYGGKIKFYDADDTESWQVDFVSEGEWNPETSNADDIEMTATPKESFTNSYFITAGIAIQFSSDEPQGNITKINR